MLVEYVLNELSYSLVTNINSNTVSVIDGIINKIIANIDTGKVPYGMALNPITKKV